jgi:eukaryotic-like serine/threonine-protein kinase
MCPGDHDLLALHRGDLGGEVLESVCGHLVTCSACQSRLAAIEQAHPDEIDRIRSLKNRVGSDLLPKQSAIDEMAKRIGRRPTSDQFAGGATVPKLRPNAEPLSHLGSYELLDELGRGGMGVVYRARHVRLNRQFAVKVIRPEYLDHPRVVSRFLREAMALGAVAHPNIVSATDADEADGRHFLVMELIEGSDLENLAKRLGPLPLADVCETIRQTALGLEAVHEQGRVHRDLKPSNLMISLDGVVKILDLGLVRPMVEEEGEGLTGNRHVMGTPDYMAPEQWYASRIADIRSDIYSLGCTFFRLLVGSVPFERIEGDYPARQLLAHAQAPRPSVRSRRPDVPEEVDSIVQKMLAVEPGQRYQTPLAVAESLASFCQGSDLSTLVVTARAGGPGAEEHPPAKRPPATPARSTPSSGGRVRTWVVRISAFAIAAIVVTTVIATVCFLRSDLPEKQESRVDADDPTPGDWFEPLRRPPSKLMWSEGKRDHFFQYIAAQRELRLDSPSVGLVRFGRIGGRSFRLNMEIHQNQWVGASGVFFGARETTKSGRPSITCQVLELRPQQVLYPMKGFLVALALVSIEDRGDGPVITAREELASAKIASPLGMHVVHVLSLDVSEGRMEQIRWDDQVLQNAVDSKKTPQLDADALVGDFGAFVQKCHAVYRNVHLLVPDRSAR